MWPGQQPPGGEQNPQDPNQNPYQQQPGYPTPNPYQQPGQQPGQPQQPGAYPQPGQQPGQQGHPGQQPGQPGPPPGPPTPPPGQPGQQQPGQPGQFPEQPGQYPGQPGQQDTYPGQQGPYPGQQPGGVPQWNVPTAPMGSPKSSDDDRRKTTIIAIVAATAVVVAAGVTGFLVLGGDKGEEAKGGGDAKPPASSSAAPSSPAASPSEENPRGGNGVEPVVKGWNVVVNPKRGTAFDVPKDWQIEDPGRSIGYTEKDDPSKPITSMTGVAEYEPQWCEFDENKDGRMDDWSLAAAGTKGASGAKNTGEAAQNTVGWWVYGPVTQPSEKKVKLSKPTPFTTDSGLKGSIAYAESDGTVKKDHKCHKEGKAVSFAFKNSVNDYVVWSLFGPKDVKGELDDATIKKILKSIRLSGDPIQD